MFEDVVKMICTTNCSWALTQSMVSNLCAELGDVSAGGTRVFPTAQAIAATSEAFLRKKIRMGYRSPYVLAFARLTSKGDIDPEQWRISSQPTDEIYADLRSIKGVGPYAAANLLKLIGRYDYLGIDSWCRKRFAELHKNGRVVKDRTIERHYASLGPWRGLFFWLDLTKEWYREKFPF